MLKINEFKDGEKKAIETLNKIRNLILEADKKFKNSITYKYNAFENFVDKSIIRETLAMTRGIKEVKHNISGTEILVSW